MTVNWLDPDDFSQKTATRCLRRIKGSITYDVLEMPIRSVLNEFAIYEKMGSMTTDGGSNFIKSLGLVMLNLLVDRLLIFIVVDGIRLLKIAEN